MADIITDSEMVLGTVFVTDKGAWTKGTVYETNDIVHTDDGVFMSLVDNNSSTPNANTDKWRTWVDKTDINNAIVKANSSATVCIMDQFEYAKLVGLNNVSLTTLYLIKAITTSQLTRLYYGETLCEIQKETSTMTCNLSLHGTENGWSIAYTGESNAGDYSGSAVDDATLGSNIYKLGATYSTSDSGVVTGSALFSNTNSLQVLDIDVMASNNTTRGTVTIELGNIPLLTQINVRANRCMVKITSSGCEVTNNDSAKYSKKLQYLLPNWDTIDGGVSYLF